MITEELIRKGVLSSFCFDFEIIEIFDSFYMDFYWILSRRMVYLNDF